MGEKGGEVYTSERFDRELLRADLCAIATTHCYKHGTRMVDDILARFDVTRKPIKEMTL